MQNCSGRHLTVMFLYWQLPYLISSASNRTTVLSPLWMVSGFGSFTSLLQFSFTGSSPIFYFNLSSCSSLVFLNSNFQSRCLQKLFWMFRIFKNHSLLRSGGSLGGEKKSVFQVYFQESKDLLWILLWDWNINVHFFSIIPCKKLNCPLR